MRILVRLLPLLIFLTQPIHSAAQEMGGPADIPLHVVASQDGIAPGTKMRIAVVYEIPPRYHIQINEFLYASPAAGETFTIDHQVVTPTRKWEGEPILAGKVAVLYDLALPSDTPLGERSLRIAAGFQSCVEDPVFACFPPEDREAVLKIPVVAAGAPIHPANPSLFPKAPPARAGGESPGAASPAESAPPTGQATEGAPSGATTSIEPSTRPENAPGEAGEVAAPTGASGDRGGDTQSSTKPTSVGEGLAAKLREALEKGSWIAFLLVFIAGFLTSFTPCVYPMIPITIGYVAGASRGRLSGFILSLFFVLGIAIVYSVLGIAAALSGGIFGAALQSKAALVVIASVFVLMGASMLGAFDISLPSGLQTRLQSGRRGGWLGAVLMGGVTGLVASPCVGPVLVVLLTWVAQVGRPVYGFGLLFTFAIGLGLLFLVLGTFVGAIKGLPRAGAWMETVKHYFGWIFLGLAAFYLRHVIGPNGTMIVYGALLIVLATQIGAFISLTEEATKGARWRKGIGIVLAVLGIGMMTSGLFTQHGWRERVGAALETHGTGGAAIAGPRWRVDEGTALAEALAENRPVLIDFTADWCAACHELDRETWSDPEVARELARYTAVRIDLTDNNPMTAGIRSRWNVAGLPTVIVLDGSGSEVERFFGFRSPEQVLPLLRRVG